MRKTELKRKTPIKRGGPIGSAPKKVPKIPKSTKTEYRNEKKAPTVAQLDKLWATVVKTRDNFECRLWGVGGRQCGSVMAAHHIFARWHRNTRWNSDVGITLCAGHHLWVHASPAESTEQIRTIIGEGLYQTLCEEHFKTVHHTADDRRRLFAELSEELARLKA